MGIEMASLLVIVFLVLVLLIVFFSFVPVGLWISARLPA